MINGICHSGNLGSLGNLGGWDLIGLIVNLVFWIGLIAGLALLVVYAIRRSRVPAAAVPYAGGQSAAGRLPTAKEILQAQYARGEISREEYELRKQAIE